MPALDKLALTALCAWSTGTLASAQRSSAIETRHRAGQTFVTWRESPMAGVRYRVYRAEEPLRSAEDLARADLLGEVDDRSSRNQGRSLATGTEHTWIIAPGGAPLDQDQGLFVHTAAMRTRRAYYAVTSVEAGVETRTLLPGVNATRLALFEAPAPPQPVLQSGGAGGELWGHWVGDRDTPYQPALGLWPSRGFNFLLQVGTAPGPRGLVLRLHAAGQTYAQAWPQRFEVPQDVDCLGLSDLMPYTSWSFWFGSHELLPSTPTPETRVWNYTQQRLLWTLDWVSAHLGVDHDPERVYVAGASLGAIGGMYLVNEYPERFAAAFLRNGLYDLRATDYRNPLAFQRLFGSFTLDLPTRDGLPILQRTNAVFMAGRDPARDWPVLRTISGRNDETVGWMSAVGLFEGLARVGRPAVHYFDERTHTPDGYWRALERVLLRRTFDTRRDRPSLRFGECTLDDDAGDGTRADGDPVGTINGYLDYDPRTASATPDVLRFDVYLRDQGMLDDAPLPRARATLGPGRTGPFAPRPGEAVLYTLRASGELVDEHLLFADAHGRVRTPPAPLELARRECRFERGVPATSAELFVGGAPLAGDELQVVLRGRPGKSWTLAVAVGGASGPFPGVPLFFVEGVLDESGVAERWLELPRSVPARTRLWSIARIGGRVTPLVAVTVQDGEGWGPEHLERR